MIYKLKSEEQAQKRLKIMYIYAGVMSTIQIFLLYVVPLFFVQEEGHNVRFWVESDMQTFSYAVLLVSYTVVIIQLQILLWKLREYYSKHYCNIMLQFFFFFLAFLCQLVLLLLYELGDYFLKWGDF